MDGTKRLGGPASWLGYFGLAVAACLPCVAIPLAAALLGGSGVGLALGFTGVSAVLAALAGIALAAILLFLRMRRAAGARAQSAPSRLVMPVTESPACHCTWCDER